jgi:antigen flippase
VSKKNILKSSGIIGSAQLFNILIGLIRNKVAAFLLGPSGIGLLGLFSSILDTIRASTSLGINYSSIKSISESKSKNDFNFLAETIFVIKSWAMWTGLIGVILTIIFSRYISIYSFKNDSYTFQISLMSIALLFTSLSQINLAILQGMQWIKKMVIASILGALLSLFILPIYYYWGNNGIVPGLVFSSVISYLITLYFCSDLQIPKVSLSTIQIFRLGFPMVKLGIFIVFSSIISGLGLYIVRAFLSNKGGLELLGNFQASWTISTGYISILLATMQTDFLPRLTSKINYRILTRKLLNDQLEVLFIVGSPILILLIYFSKNVISILYSSEFINAALILQWNLLSVMFIFVGWTLGVYFLAKGLGKFIIITDLFWFLIFGLFIYFGFSNLGASFIGVSYFVATLLKSILNYIILYFKLNFYFSTRNVYIFCFYFSLMVLSFVLVNSLDGDYLIFSGILLFFLSLIFSYYQLSKVFNVKELFVKIKGLIIR